jgi:large subunit ribosomal protein L15
MNLHDLHAKGGARKRRARVGRGRASGKGKTCGYGHNGQRSRSGDRAAGTYEGGQMPLFRRLPRRGFNNATFATRYAIVNVGDLNRFDDGTEVDTALLLRTGLVTTVGDGVKILGDGELERRLTVKAHRFSKTARAKIEAAGGQTETL